MDFFWALLNFPGSDVITTIILVIDVILRIVALVIIPYNRRPAASMAWLLLIMINPIIGWLIFSVLGNTRLPKARRKKMREIMSLIEARVRDAEDDKDANRTAAWFPGVLKLNRSLTNMPHVGGNAITVISEFDAQLDAMVRAIDSATKRVHVEFYLMVESARTRRFFDALARARERGVEVRVLIDHITAVRYPRTKETRERLEHMGAELHYMMPLRPWKGQWQRIDLRNHRKLVVIDGRVGFVGSLNLIDPSYLWKKNIRRGLIWRDLWIEMQGPIVAELEALFLSDWWLESNELLSLLETDERPGEIEASLIPSGPGFSGEVNLRVFNELVHSAEERLVIVSPYFVPDDTMSYAITSAALRGVRVELYASAIGDQFWTFHAQRSYYESLLRHGVKIYLYSEPTVLHSKFMTFDNDAAIVGSSNIDMRSFGLNFEVSVLTEGREMVEELNRVADHYRRSSHLLTLESWLKRPAITRVFDNVARLSSALQ